MKELCKILIVDDEFIMRQGLKFMVDWEAEGFQIVGEASNGKDGLELIEELHPHIVLCDVVMPVMDGIDFTKIVHAKYPEVRIIVLSGYDKFEYVKTTLMNGVNDYLLKPTLTPEELMDAVRKTANKIPGMELGSGESLSYTQRLTRFLSNQDKTISIETMRNLFHYTCYRVLTIRIRHPHGKRSLLTNLLYQKVEEWSKEEREYDVICFREEDQIVGIVFNYGIKQREQVVQEIWKLGESFAFIDSNVFGVFCDETMNLNEIKVCYESMIKRDIYQSFYRGQYIFQKQVEKKETKGKRFDFYGFTNCLNSGQYMQAITMLEEYIKQAIENQIEEYYLKNQVKTLCYSLLAGIEATEQVEQKRREMFQQIDATENEQEFETIASELMKQFKQLVEQKQTDELIQEILFYISENYEKELNLMEVAEVFGFNYSYLSTYFHTHKGEGFSEYLNQIRVEQACKLLEKREKSIADISELVGYREHSYFCRVFKKVTGKTPSQYRREGERK